MQPPSGGCVLKPQDDVLVRWGGQFPAAFGRLCVDTVMMRLALSVAYSAAFGRLCVETGSADKIPLCDRAAAFGRLCVETGGFLFV